MISGLKTGPEKPVQRCHSARRWIGWLAAVVFTTAAWPAFAFDIDSLMALLAQRRSGEALFSEQRFVRGIDVPLESSGSLSFEAPDRFVRRTLKPRPETMDVNGNIVTLSRSGRSRKYSLDATPEMIGLVEAVRATLTGNAGTIRRYFKPELSGTVDNWALLLTPLESRLAGQVESIRLAGRRGELASIEMELPGGDRSLMTIVPLRADIPAAAAASRP